MVDGLVMVASRHGPKATIGRLEAAVSQRGMAIVARIDHAAAAEAAGLSLRPTEVLVFGNAKAGTPLMAAAPTLAIDLPLKILVWTDDAGATQLAYIDPAWLAARHGLVAADHPQLAAMSAALADIVRQAAD
jgi:uncharacterized protein (DUF302 family)